MLFTSCLLLSAGLAQAASPAVEAKAAMSRLQYLVGTWEGEGWMIVESEGWRWEIKGPQGVIRFVMKLSAEGHWLEIGERSSDGQTWTKFFEMTLKKQP
jgi:hypothetical protein